MAKNKIYTVPYKRKEKTDYRKRLKYLASEKTRIVIRTTTNTTSIQAIDFNENGDFTRLQFKSTDLVKYGWKHNTGSVPSSYLTGYAFARKSKLKEGVIDLGYKTIIKGSKISATIKGIVDGGIKLKYNEKIFPDFESIKNKFSDFEVIKNKIESEK